MSKYKIDDIVRVTGDKSALRTTPIFVDMMERFAGKNAVVTNIDNFGITPAYSLKLCENGRSYEFWFYEKSIIGWADDYVDDIASTTPAELDSLIALSDGVVRA